MHIVDDYYLQGILAKMKQKSWWKEVAPFESEQVLYKPYRRPNCSHFSGNRNLGDFNFNLRGNYEKKLDLVHLKLTVVPHTALLCVVGVSMKIG